MKLTFLAAATLFCAALATPAFAIPITDVVNPADTSITDGSTPSPCPSGFTCTSGKLSFVQDITDNGFTLGSLITSAAIAIHLLDAGGGSEAYTYTIGAAQIFSSVNVPGGSGSTDTVPLSAASIADLMADGKITISVASTSGTFEFADSTLTAQVTPAATGIPEPSLTSLLVLAFATMIFFLRRRSGAR
jgi:hypothetical protein